MNNFRLRCSSIFLVPLLRKKSTLTILYVYWSFLVIVRIHRTNTKQTSSPYSFTTCRRLNNSYGHNLQLTKHFLWTKVITDYTTHTDTSRSIIFFLAQIPYLPNISTEIPYLPDILTSDQNSLSRQNFGNISLSGKPDFGWKIKLQFIVPSSLYFRSELKAN